MERVQSLDLARGFTVLFIPAIHSVMIYSHPGVHHSWLGYLLRLVAEGPGAQVFMTIMGIVFTFRKKHPASSVVLRSLFLLLAGYLLNIFKFVTPYSIGALPAAILKVLEIDNTQNIIWRLIAMGDILHFAAIALLVIFVVYQSKYYPIVSISLVLVVICCAPFIWDISHPSPLIGYLLQLFAGKPPQTFFPVFPWIVYPLLGLFIGYCWQHHIGKLKAYSLHVSLLCLVIGIMVSKWSDQQSPFGFYRTYPGETLMHIGIALLWLALWNWLTKQLRPNAFFRLLSFCSKEITLIYVIQWILIFWLLPFIGYETLSTFESLIIAIYSTAVTLGLGYLMTHKKQKYGYK